MKRVYLVRHGQTDWNRDLRFRGRIDVPLNERGRREAEAIAEALRDENIDAIYTSPLSRAVESARPAARLFNLEIVPVEGLIDISYGTWEGLPFHEVRQRYTDEYLKWEERPHLVRFPSGETLDEVRERSLGALRDIVSNNPGKSILIIPHRVINKVIACAILGINNSHFWEIKQDTGCINVIDYSSEGFALCMMNDTCHLRGIGDEAAQPDF
jgi:broad specificity phosphatase PhoE